MKRKTYLFIDYFIFKYATVQGISGTGSLRIGAAFLVNK
jgi:hypothetical protein